MSQTSRKEFSVKAFILGCVLSAVMVASNLYLGLKMGFSVAASIPAAVLSIILLKAFKQTSILEHNLVQTTASAGEVVALGASFTLPALFMMGYWTDVPFLTTFLITSIGGCAGVLCVSLFRKSFLQDKDLNFPEGRATAEVLKTQVNQTGYQYLIYGGFIGACLKFLQDGVTFLKGTWHHFTHFRGAFFGVEVGFGMALLGAGYTVGLSIGFAMLLGSLLSWGIFLPALSFLKGIPEGHASVAQSAFILWNQEVRLIGVGMMVFGGVFVSLKLFKPLGVSLKKSLQHKYFLRNLSISEQKGIPPLLLTSLLLLCGIIVAIFIFFKKDNPLSMVGIGIITLFIGLLWLLTSLLGGYMSGLIGSSSSPVSGISLLGLLSICGLLIFVAFSQSSDALPPLAIVLGAIVTCAAAVSTNALQSLKTGDLVKASPWKQQLMLLIGVLVASSLVGPFLHILFKAYGLYGSSLEGNSLTPLAAPKAALMKGLVEALFQSKFKWHFFLVGNLLAAATLLADYFLRKKWDFHLPVLAVALGFYMPMEISVPTFVGGLIRFFAQRKKGRSKEHSDFGILFAAGLIAGDSLMGILIAFLLVGSLLPQFQFTQYQGLLTFLSVATFACASWILYRFSLRKA